MTAKSGKLVTPSRRRWFLGIAVAFANVVALTGQTGATVATAASFNLDQHGLTGAWYNASTGGQGLLIESYKDLQGAGKGYLT
ncbi:MAG: hypothetical protein ABI846_01010, partial [Rudaea sp.]